MRTAVNVQHLPGHLMDFCQVNDRVYDILHFGNLSHRLQLPENILRVMLCMGVSTTPGATTFTRMPCFTYSIARLRMTASRPPFVIIAT
jgi:hypothetical protein